MVKRAQGSNVQPFFEAVDLPPFGTLSDTAAKVRNGKEILRLVVPDPGGRLIATVRISGGTSGDLTWKAVVKQPKSYEFTLSR